MEIKEKRINNKIKGLYIIWGIMVIFFMSVTMTNSQNDIVSIIINIFLLAVVLVIFFNSGKKMKKIYDITEDLKNVTYKIQTDSEIENGYLWEKYLNIQPEELFHNNELIQAYKRYMFERKRLSYSTENKYKCSIEDYINEEFIDSVMKKNVLNLVPGVMTGLGILGTFVGLTFGLQNFNTGNSSEIAASIAPLMNGIKVAFHTSIGGMVFSLVFNFIYKETLEDAYISLDNFLQAFDSYVDSDAEMDNNSALYNMMQNMPEKIGEKVAEIVNPSIERMNTILENFTNNISETQIDGVAKIVDSFMESMNASLGDSFTRLGETIDKTCELQRENGETMSVILNEINGMTDNLININTFLGATIENMSGYVEKIESFQEIINDNFIKVKEHLEYQKEYDDKLKEYIDILVNYERQIGEASNKFTEDMSKQLELLGEMEERFSESTKEHLEVLAIKADEYNKTLTDMAKQELGIVLSMAGDYSEQVTKHLNELGEMSEKLTEESIKNLNILSENAELYNQMLADKAKEQMDSIITISNQRTNDMEKASAELAEVCRQLNDKVTLSLNNVFKVIDENLADITKHLSGTIVEIDETTERVPQVVKSAYDGMKDTFDRLAKKYELFGAKRKG